MRSRWFGLVMAGLAVGLSLWAYPRLPERVVTHWNVHGQPDGWSPRLLAVAIVPLVLVALTGLFALLPRIDPRRANYEKFLDTYWLIANGVLTFMVGVHALTIASGLGMAVPIERVVPLGVGVLLIFLGNYLARVEPNWFVGIRTPWTLSSDTVWRRTHRTGGPVFVVAGVVVAVAAIAPRAAALPIMVVAIAAASLIPVVQSYILWRREQG
jgi:uncharacterized membrane protein